MALHHALMYVKHTIKTMLVFLYDIQYQLLSQLKEGQSAFSNVTQ